MLLACFLFSLMAVFAKLAMAVASTSQAIFFRAWASIPFLLWYIRTHHIPVLRGRQKRLLVTRGIIGLIGVYLYFYSLRKIPVGNANMLNATSPIFVAFLAGPLLKEPVSRKIYGALPIFITGLALIFRPTISIAWVPHLMALASGLASATAYLTIRQLTKKEPVSVVVFYFSVVALLGSIPPAFADWHPLNVRTFWLLTASGVFAMLAQLAMTRAYQLEKASVVSLFAYAGPVFTYIAGILVFHEIPNLSAVVGAMLVVLCATWVLRANRQPGS
jgi:drug/metabolite transporter (DMT)-like permease